MKNNLIKFEKEIEFGDNYMLFKSVIEIEDKRLDLHGIYVKDTNDIYVWGKPLGLSVGLHSNSITKSLNSKVGEYIVDIDMVFRNAATASLTQELPFDKFDKFFGVTANNRDKMLFLKERGVIKYIALNFDSYLDYVLDFGSTVLEHYRKYGYSDPKMDDRTHEENLEYKKKYEKMLEKYIEDTAEKDNEIKALLKHELMLVEKTLGITKSFEAIAEIDPEDGLYCLDLPTSVKFITKVVSDNGINYKISNPRILQALTRLDIAERVTIGSGSSYVVVDESQHLFVRNLKKRSGGNKTFIHLTEMGLAPDFLIKIITEDLRVRGDHPNRKEAIINAIRDMKYSITFKIDE